MNKKLASFFMAIICIFAMSTMAFAAPSGTQLKTVTINNDVLNTEKPAPASSGDEREVNIAAPQVSSVAVLGYNVVNGRFHTYVKVMGNGNYRATINGYSATYLGWYDTVGYNPVYGWYEEFDCGLAKRGYNEFKITATSVNYPYTVKSTSAWWNY